ncbi:MAG: UDP-N-acetylglucosamine 2-epimerase [Pseudoflavonifractor sp.]|nr:UDP-N-acetylglucosamine 2-epimerase [Alloprevotella sp.]MCM1116886.1 UDP-N-acetylglucosamine 2-epimerase [Pseudoflavonifractor sp.]
MRHICIATGTRADWGLLCPIARELSLRPDTRVSIVATNMHLDERYGATASEILADGFSIADSFDITSGLDDSPFGRAVATGRATQGMADALELLRPDLLVILGDRFEMLGIASAAALMRVPIVHIAGGEISEGAIDDSMRHAITKLASLHLTATEPYRRRVINMGENPERVINTGAIGVDNIVNGRDAMTEGEFADSLDGFPFPKGSLLVTLHPCTLADSPAATVCSALLQALDHFSDRQVIITYPNNDAGSEDIIRLIEDYGRKYPLRVKVIRSLGRRRYHAALARAGAVVGNSSSGIVEVPSMHIPTVNIGPRQKGRVAGPSVINCPEDTLSITNAISHALSPEGQSLALRAANPYYKPDTLNEIVKAIAETPLELLHTKRFVDPYPLQ